MIPLPQRQQIVAWVEEANTAGAQAQGQSHPLSRCIRLKRLLLVHPIVSIGH